MLEKTKESEECDAVEKNFALKEPESFETCLETCGWFTKKPRWDKEEKNYTDFAAWIENPFEHNLFDWQGLAPNVKSVEYHKMTKND